MHIETAWVRMIKEVCYKPYGPRTGQVLFNYLPLGAQNVVAGTMIDPFNKELSDQELFVWLNEHVVFDKTEVDSAAGVRIIAVFNNNRFIWEEEDV